MELSEGARRDGNAFFVRLIGAAADGIQKNDLRLLPRQRATVALRAPWDGRIVWARDSLARLWIATADEGSEQACIGRTGYLLRRA